MAGVELTHWWFRARREIVRRVLSCLVPPSRGALVIDVGCGTGTTIASLADRYDCLGVDAAEDAIRLARKRFASMRFICGTAPDLGEAAGRANAVLLMDVLEHVPDDAAVLGSIVDALRPGCHVLITVPADMKLWSSHDVSLGHVIRYDVERLRQMYAGLPVTELMVTHFNTRLYPVVRAMRRWGLLRGHVRARDGTDLKVPGALPNWILHRVFVGESRRLVSLARRRRSRGYSYGASLMAVLRRDATPNADRARSGAADGDVA